MNELVGRTHFSSVEHGNPPNCYPSFSRRPPSFRGHTHGLTKNSATIRLLLLLRTSLNEPNSHFSQDMAEILASATQKLLVLLSEKSGQVDPLSNGVDLLKGRNEGKESIFPEQEAEILFLLRQVHIFGPRSEMANDELPVVTGLSKKVLRPFTLNLRQHDCSEKWPIVHRYSH